MSTVMHLSDMHFGTESPPVLAALTRQIVELSPDVVVISGDLTQRARRREFRAARRFIDAVNAAGCVVVLVPGNHDSPWDNPVARLLWPFKRYRAAIGGTAVSLTRVDRLQFITVNSVRRERHASGYITARRSREVVAKTLHRHEGDVTIVVTHHPLGTTALSEADAGHQGDAQTCRAWHAAGVNLVLSGHVHRPFLLDATEQLVQTGEDSERPLWILNAGTAISHRVRHDYPNSFNLLHFSRSDDSWDMQLERWDYSSQGARFEMHLERQVALG